MTGQTCDLVLSAFDFGPQMVLGVALSDVLDQWTVIWQEVRCDVDSLGMPYLAVLEAELLRVQSGQEAQLCADAEIAHDDVECLVE